MKSGVMFGWTFALLLAMQLTARQSQAAVYFIHADHLNTPLTMTNQTGTVVWRADIEPFGKANVITAVVAMNLRFPGQYFDAETQIHYNFHRDYDPVVGRYLQSDPVGLKGGLNTYAYVDGNPLRFVDPRGLDGKGAAASAISKVGSEDYQWWDPEAAARGRLSSLVGGRFSNKCNFFEYEVLTEGGDPPGLMPDGRKPSAGEYADPHKIIPGYPVVVMRPGERPKLGDIVAGNGHVGTYVPLPSGDSGTVSASANTQSVVHNDWGFRPNQDFSPTIRRCECDL